MIYRQLTYADLQLSPADLYEALGYETTTPPDAETQREVQCVIDEVAAHVMPSFAFVTEGAAALEEFAPGPIILSQMRGSQAVCWFMATAGAWYEEYQQRLTQAGDMVRVYIANELGSLIAERAADLMEQALEEQTLPKGLGHTARFSPGYCGWPLTDQPHLFARFGTGQNPCHITLTDSALMLPIKSVSGVIGIGREVKKHDYTCGLCSLESCYKKRKKTNPPTPQ